MVRIITDEQLIRVKDYVKEAFKGMTRLSGEPVYTHSFQMQEILKERDYDNNFQAVALLHDIIEDTEKTYDDLKIDLPFLTDSIILGVASLTKEDDMTLEESLQNAKNNEYGKVIKGVDRLQNALTTYKYRNTQKFISGFLYKSIKFYIPVLEEVDNEFLPDLRRELLRLNEALSPSFINLLKKNIGEDYIKSCLERIYQIHEYRSCEEHYLHGTYSRKSKAEKILKDNGWLNDDCFEIEEILVDYNLWK